MEILVFKTNISRSEHVDHLAGLLSKLPEVSQVTIDLDDCDRVLRVGTSLSPRFVETVVQEAGHECSELED